MILGKENIFKHYQIALEELDSHNPHKGVWAKAYSETDNEDATRRLYIKLRVAQLSCSKDDYIKPPKTRL
jgi:hypothetical protein